MAVIENRNTRSDIVEVTLDDIYGGEEKTAIKIGTPYGETDRVVIQTHSNTYILFTTDAVSIKIKSVRL
ncbi:hypothetical protein [Parageobacillus thermoglucosidasius]|uniref:SunI/YnzG family protein n=1 Tax=Parageobacillus thermoglucosidasius TaxID=1426 RepID=UPI0004430376|nr:hypothetical protein [Parageobacillus thermoglucosidasius]GAJ44104.1 hypothetical protein GT2_14_01180 [Parageobacillus thermoglucosidasius NBRC 107763]